MSDWGEKCFVRGPRTDLFMSDSSAKKGAPFKKGSGGGVSSRGGEGGVNRKKLRVV